MELSTFVSQSLVAIAKGIEQANVELQGSAAQVNPSGVIYSSHTPPLPYLSSPDNLPRVQIVDFDVAVVVTESETNRSGGGIGVAIASVGMTGTSTAQRESVSRLKFSVPVLLPIPPRKEPHIPPPKEPERRLRKQHY